MCPFVQGDYQALVARKIDGVETEDMLVPVAGLTRYLLRMGQDKDCSPGVLAN